MRKFLEQNKMSYTKVMAVIFMIGFVVGIFAANISTKEYFSQTGILSDYFISRYKYMDIAYSGLFWFVMKKRMKWVFLLWGMGLTILGVPLVWGFVGWLGISAGMLLSVAVIRFGFLGIIICCLALVPQYIVYIPVYVFFVNCTYTMSLSQYGIGRVSGHGGPSGKQLFLRYVMVLAVVVALVLAGVFLESYINPVILKSVLKNI